MSDDSEEAGGKPRELKTPGFVGRYSEKPFSGLAAGVNRCSSQRVGLAGNPTCQALFFGTNLPRQRKSAGQ